jgi:hypothetical protein
MRYGQTHKTRIFDPFFTTKFLAADLEWQQFRYCKQNESTIRIESEPGKGSSFCVLPACSIATADISLASQAETGNVRKNNTPVDDEQIVLNEERRCLKFSVLCHYSR